jgi:hypothetical protein
MAANVIVPDDRFGSGPEVPQPCPARLLLGAKQT